MKVKRPETVSYGKAILRTREDQLSRERKFTKKGRGSFYQWQLAKAIGVLVGRSSGWGRARGEEGPWKR